MEYSYYFNPTTTGRKKTIISLFAQLQQVRVICVRGPPYSGKTTICELLEYYVKTKRKDIDICYILWRPDIRVEWKKYHSQTNLLILMNGIHDVYLNKVLWPLLIKPIAKKRYGPMIALFGPYGRCIDNRTLPQIVPMDLASDQQLSLRPLPNSNSKLSILFTRSEFEDCMTRVIKQSGICKKSFLPSKEFIEQLWVMTNGHPGVFNEMIRFLIEAEVCLINKFCRWLLYIILTSIVFTRSFRYIK